MERGEVGRTYAGRVWLAVTIVMIVIVAAAMTVWLRHALLILFGSILFAVFLTRLSMLVTDQTGFRYGVSLAIIVLVLTISAAALMIFMGSQMVQQVGQFSEQFQTARKEFLDRWERSELPSWLGAAQQASQPSGLGQRALSTAQSAIAKMLWAIGGLIFVAITGFYFALQAGNYRAGFLKLVPMHARRRVDGVVQKVAETLWWWTLGRLVGMAVIGVGSTFGLWMLNIPLPVTQGVLAGLLNFVPNLGPLVASVPPLLLALQQGPNTVWYVAGFYLALQFVESYFLTPLIDQHQVQLPPGLVLAAQLIMGAVAGVLGLLLATPVAVVLFVIIREFYVKDMLGDHTALRAGRGTNAAATT